METNYSMTKQVVWAFRELSFIQFDIKFQRRFFPVAKKPKKKKKKKKKKKNKWPKP